LNEFELVDSLISLLPSPAPEVIVPAGIDDCAVLRIKEDFFLVTADSLVEGTHFLESWTEIVPELFYFLGRKLVLVNVSDIVSTGGIPKYGILNVGVKNENSVSQKLEAFFSGISEECKKFGISIIGGDTVSSEKDFFSLTLMGTAKKLMLRNYAKVGDYVGVYGKLGESRAGLEQLLKKEVKFPSLLESFLLPPVGLKIGRELSELGVKCCMDISDGLLVSLYLLSKSSKVAISVDSSKIPLCEELVEYCGKKELALEYALVGGEDYSLLLTYPESLKTSVENLGVKTIGEVKEGKGIFLDGKEVKPKGYDAFGGLK